MRKSQILNVDFSLIRHALPLIRHFSHADIYRNLPDKVATESEPPSEQSSASANDRSTLPFSTEYQYSTDTVDGKPVKVQTKTEKSYVRD